jgi:hypothetical protein
MSDESRTPITDAVEHEGITKYGRHIAARGYRLQDALTHARRMEKDRKELRDALVASIKSVRAWHGMGIPKHLEEEMWNLYWENSPEMKPLRELLSRLGDK